MNILEKPLHSALEEQRKSARKDVTIMAHIRVSGGLRNKITITDLSRSGFQMDCLAFIPDERPVFLTLPGFVQIECMIRWRSKWHYGCTFVSPLHQAVYDQIVSDFPAIQSAF